MSARRLALALGLLALSACGPDSPDGKMPPPPSGSVTLGTSALDGTGFFPLAGDQTLVPGAQGGFHIWLKYRVEGMPAGPVGVHRTVRRISDNRLILDTSGTVEIGAPGADGAWESPSSIPSFMCPAPLGVQVFDTPVRFEAVFTAESGEALGEGTAEATPRCPTDGQAGFCISICAG